MQSGYGVSEFQQLLVDGCSPFLSMSNDINSSQPQKLHLQEQQQHSHPYNHQQQLQQQRFYHLHPNPITQQFFQNPLQLQLLQQQQQQRLHQQLGLDLESGPENSNSSSPVVGGGAALPFIVPNFKLPDENSGCREALNDDETVLVGSRGDSRVAIGNHQRWHHHREEDPAIEEPFWTPLDNEYINRNNKRCKEKVEISNKFSRKGDDHGDENEVGKNSSSNYGLFRELEAIYTHGGLSGSGGCANQTGSGSALTGDPPLTAVAEARPTGVDHGSETSTGEEASLKKIQKSRRKKKRKQLSSIASFFESLVKQLMAQQQTLHSKFLEVMEKRDEERTKREEAWRRQEMAKSSREAAARAQEQALASSREAAIVAFLEKITGEAINLPTKTQFNSQAQIHEKSEKEENAKQDTHVFNNNNNNVSKENNNCNSSSRRWPKTEVLALIRVRSSLESRFQEPGLKGPLWEEVSNSMASIGYQRSAKRCKEKWENINKYFRKTKDSAKKRSQHSKTCPYFQQLDQLYSSSAKPSVPDDNSELLDAIVVAIDQNPSLDISQTSFKFSEMGPQGNENVNKDTSAIAENEEDNEEEEEDEEDDDDEEEKGEKEDGEQDNQIHMQ